MSKPIGRQTAVVRGHHHEQLPGQQPVTLPIVQTTTFVMDAALNAAFERGDYRSEYLYTRHANPTIDVLQRRLAELHSAEDAVCFASGMAAVSTALIALTAPGDGVLADTLLYGATNTFLGEYLTAMGRQVAFAPLADADAARAALDSLERPRLVYGETLANPLVQALDLPAAAALADRAGALLLVDNTFAGPMLCRPLEHGADVVIESLSKSIAGHSDVHGGLVCGSAELVAPVWRGMVHLGGCLDPHAAWMIWRGAKTLAMRTSAAQDNARLVAAALRAEPRVERVYFADEDAGAAHWLDGPGAMLSFVVRGGDAAAQRFMDALQFITPATSLGGVESLVSLPYNTSHRTKLSQERIGLLPGTVRLSVGCETAVDLVEDVRRALASLG